MSCYPLYPIVSSAGAALLSEVVTLYGVGWQPIRGTLAVQVVWALGQTDLDTVNGVIKLTFCLHLLYSCSVTPSGVYVLFAC